MKNYEQLNIEQVVSETDTFTEERYKLFNRYLPPRSINILDIGCNTGRGGAVLKKIDNSRRIFGLDVVQDRLDRLPNHVYSQKIYGSCTQIPIEENTFNAVVAGEFIEHIYPSDVDKVLCEIFRVLQIRGRALLTTPNPLDLKRKLRNQSILGNAHVSQHYPNALKMRMKLIGFSNIRIVGSGRVTRYLGCHFPLPIYGSYLITGDKF